MKIAVEITLATPALVNLSALAKELQQHPSAILIEFVDAVIDYYTATDRSPELKELIEARRPFRGRRIALNEQAPETVKSRGDFACATLPIVRPPLSLESCALGQTCLDCGSSYREGCFPNARVGAYARYRHHGIVSRPVHERLVHAAGRFLQKVERGNPPIRRIIRREQRHQSSQVTYAITLQPQSWAKTSDAVSRHC